MYGTIAKALGSWLLSFGKPALTVAVIVAIGWGIHYSGSKSGEAKANAEWAKKIGKEVSKFNENVDKISKESVDSADEADKIAGLVEERIADAITDASRRAAAQAAIGTKCPETDLNSPLDPSFVEYWNQMNRATEEIAK